MIPISVRNILHLIGDLGLQEDCPQRSTKWKLKQSVPYNADTQNIKNGLSVEANLFQFCEKKAYKNINN